MRERKLEAGEILSNYNTTRKRLEMMMAQLTPKELLDYLLEDNELTSDQLDEFIRKYPEEGQYWEYKDGRITTPSKLTEGRQTIREYVSGFANSDGGVLIIGVDENKPRQIAPCSQPGGQSLNDWASRCLQDMVAYFSPQPRFQVISHSKGPALTIATARAPSLVPCVESKWPFTGWTNRILIDEC